MDLPKYSDARVRLCAYIAGALACALMCGAAFAQVAISPSSPKAQDTIHVQVPQGAIGWPTVEYRTSGALLNTFNPRATQVSMVDNKVTIAVELFNNEFGSPSQAMDLPIGQLPAGTYNVEVVRRLPDGTFAGTVGMTQFSVAPRAAGDPLWNSTDLWWNAAESGWGLSLIQHGSVLFGAWFVYGSDNKPIWYVLPGGNWTTPTEYRGSVYRTTGPYFGLGTFDPNAVNATLVGQAVITLDSYDSNAANASFTIDGTTVVKSIRREPF